MVSGNHDQFSTDISYPTKNRSPGLMNRVSFIRLTVSRVFKTY